MHTTLAPALLAFALAAASPAQTLYGNATPGAGGIAPAIWQSGTIWPGNPAFRVTLDDAVGGSPAVLLIGYTPISFPLLGIELLTVPSFSAERRTSGAAGQAGIGTASVSLRIPNLASIVGAYTYFQWAVFDSAGPQGLAATRGLRSIATDAPLVLALGFTNLRAVDPRSASVTVWPGAAKDVRFSPDGRLAVFSPPLSQAFAIMDTRTQTYVASPGVTGRPNAAAITPDGKRCYGITSGPAGLLWGAIVEIDIDPTSPRFGQVIGSVSNFPANVNQLEGVAISGDGKILAACNLGLGETPAVWTVDIDPTSPRFNTVSHSIPLPGLLYDVECNHDGSVVYVAAALFGAPGELWFVNAHTGGISGRLLGVGDFPVDLDLDPRGKRLWVASRNSHSLLRINVDVTDPAFGAIASTSATLSAPYGVAVGRDGAFAYAIEQEGDNLVEVDTTTMAVVRTFPLSTQQGGGGEAVDVR